jgi:crotonobetainyl-CoA:carnitine CoA-transferase CaiB-like acyl-CoA transferase
MFESTVSWLTVPIALTKSFGAKISRRGNTHEFFCPVSVYKTKDGFVYLAVGNDRQWESMVAQDMFKSLAREEYKKNKGRIADVHDLNKRITAITEQHTSEELIKLFTSITVPISGIKNVEQVIEDPLVAKRILSSTDPKTGTTVTLAPPPNMTPFLEASDRKLSFPPRFGEQNKTVYGDILGYSDAALAEFKEKGII